MQLNHMLALQQFMSRVTLTGAEVNAFATVMNALQADIAMAQQPMQQPAMDASIKDAVKAAVKGK